MVICYNTTFFIHLCKAETFCTLHVQRERDKYAVIKMDETGKSSSEEFTMTPLHSKLSHKHFTMSFYSKNTGSMVMYNSKQRNHYVNACTTHMCLSVL